LVPLLLVIVKAWGVPKGRFYQSGKVLEVRFAARDVPIELAAVDFNVIAHLLTASGAGPENIVMGNGDSQVFLEALNKDLVEFFYKVGLIWMS